MYLSHSQSAPRAFESTLFEVVDCPSQPVGRPSKPVNLLVCQSRTSWTPCGRAAVPSSSLPRHQVTPAITVLRNSLPFQPQRKAKLLCLPGVFPDVESLQLVQSWEALFPLNLRIQHKGSEVTWIHQPLVSKSLLAQHYKIKHMYKVAELPLHISYQICHSKTTSSSDILAGQIPSEEE